jgi:hypothetical protein
LKGPGATRPLMLLSIFFVLIGQQLSFSGM